MAKRVADSYLTDRNWDEEQEGEEAGEFKQADNATIAKRKIKTAKRRNMQEDTEGGSSSSVAAFKGFSGFTSSTSKATFSFGGVESKPLGAGGLFGGVESKPLGGGGLFGGLGGAKALSGTDASKKESNGSAQTVPVLNVTAATDKDTTETKKSAQNGTSKTKRQYMAQLKALNSSVAKWITEHVDANPYCILTPIFTDYESHLAVIEKMHGDGGGSTKGAVAGESGADTSTASSASTSALSTPAKDEGEDEKKDSPVSKPGFSFGSAAMSSTAAGSTAAGSTAGGSTAAAAFSFGSGMKTGNTGPLGAGSGTTSVFGGSTSTSMPNTTSSSSLFGSTTTSTTSSSSMFGGVAFGSSSSTTSSVFGGATTMSSSAFGSSGTSGFTFGKTGGDGASSGFSFGAAAAAKPAVASGDGNTGGGGEEEEYVPPEPEASNITEDDAFYTKRCKLFYKVKEDWKDCGVGNLFLKPCDDKTQLLVRADTSLGNILLNIMLQASVPLSRSGKNNVLMMCVPNPPVADKNVEEGAPLSMLIRVKSGDEADELLTKLQDAKEGNKEGNK